MLALHILLLCAATRNRTEIAAVLFCSRSSVYRTMRAYRAGTLGLESDAQGRLAPPVRTTVLTPSRQRARLALLTAAPPTYGWCRTRWSCATLALRLETTRGLTVSAATMRRWLHELGHLNGPWKYKLSDLYDEPAVTAAVENISAEEHAKAAA